MANFILSFFYQILYMSIIATIIGVTILGLRKILQNRFPPKISYIIWMVFIVSLLVPITIPSKISIYNFIDVDNVKYVTDKNNQKNWEKIRSKTNIKQDTINQLYINVNEMFTKSPKEIVAYIWFAIFLLKIAKTALSYYFVIREIGNHEVEDERINLILERCKKKLKIKRNIKVIKQDLLEMPSTIGIFDIKILVTDAFLRFDDIALIDVFMHELSHYKRKDNIVNFIIVVMKALHWFNPIMHEIFKVIRDDMEFATDEVAISKMNTEEKIRYCKVMVEVSTMNSLETDTVLGLSNGAKYLEERIDRISLKEEFEKHSKVIFAFAVFIMTLICLVFYPTSYGIYDIPKLYLKLENGIKVETVEVKEEKSLDLPEIRLNENSEVKLLTKNGKTYDYIFYKRLEVNNIQNSEDVFVVSTGEIEHFDIGEYIYQFTLTYADSQSVNYAIKIIVE